MKGFLRKFFSEWLQRPTLTLPMLTLAAVLAAPMAGLAANGKSPKPATDRTPPQKTETRKGATKAAKAGSEERKVARAGKTKPAVTVSQRAESPKAVPLKKAIKILASGKALKKHQKQTRSLLAATHAVPVMTIKNNTVEQGALFSQLRDPGFYPPRPRNAREVAMFGPPPSPTSALREIIADQAANFGVNPLLVQAVVAVESGFNARARSPNGALGMMQLTPATANRLGVTQPMDAEDNIRGGTLYLKMLMDQFDGDATLALAAYHAGPKTVEEHGGVPPNENTHLFLKRVMVYFNYYLEEQ